MVLNASASASAIIECGVEVSKTSRANCRICNEKITKGEVVYLLFKPNLINYV